MNKRLIFYVFIFLIIAFTIFCFSRFYKKDLIYDITFNLLSSTVEKPVKETVKLHLYDNQEVSINQVLIRAYYFVPEDKGDFIMNDWQQLFSRSLENVSAFYQLQFAYNMEMDFEIYPEIIYSEQTADYFESLIKQDYSEELKQPHSPSLTLKEIVDELQEKIDLEEKQGDFYLINLFFLNLGRNSIEVKEEKEIYGLNDEKNNCLVIANAFSNEEIRSFYESIVAHEISHGLGVPEAYLYSSDKVDSYGLMGVGFTRRLENNYLDDEIKKEMGLD